VDLFFEDFSGCCQPAPPKFCLAVKAFKNFHPKKTLFGVAYGIRTTRKRFYVLCCGFV
jgi:hypothetical protein